LQTTLVQINNSRQLYIELLRTLLERLADKTVSVLIKYFEASAYVWITNLIRMVIWSSQAASSGFSEWILETNTSSSFRCGFNLSPQQYGISWNGDMAAKPSYGRPFRDRCKLCSSETWPSYHVFILCTFFKENLNTVMTYDFQNYPRLLVNNRLNVYHNFTKT